MFLPNCHFYPLPPHLPLFISLQFRWEGKNSGGSHHPLSRCQPEIFPKLWNESKTNIIHQRINWKITISRFLHWQWKRMFSIWEVWLIKRLLQIRDTSLRSNGFHDIMNDKENRVFLEWDYFRWLKEINVGGANWKLVASHHPLSGCQAKNFPCPTSNQL